MDELRPDYDEYDQSSPLDANCLTPYTLLGEQHAATSCIYTVRIAS